MGMPGLLPPNTAKSRNHEILQPSGQQEMNDVSIDCARSDKAVLAIL